MKAPPPPRCLECHKYDHHLPQAACRICKGFGLEETRLCAPDRMIQKPDWLVNNAYLPQGSLAI
ncbi:MAG: hypothetical protein HY892_01315 [Deltaproteobacteria bacterium]|nr:hypothetical protein [Deltaproteobacteria bacterium]